VKLTNASYSDVAHLLKSSDNISMVLGRGKIVERKQEVKMAILLFLQTCLTEGTACFLHFPRISTTYRGRVFSIPCVV